ncbi:MAG: ATP-dependent Clp protease ATP-binding subunit [Patescibacteria group bacterium]
MSNHLTSKFTDRFKMALIEAHNLALSLQHVKINPEHLLHSLVNQNGALSAEILKKFQLKTSQIETMIIAKNKRDDNHNLVPTISPETKKIIQKSALLASRLRHKYIGTEHLLFALLQSEDKTVKNILTQNNVNLESLKHQVEVILKSTSKFLDITAGFNQSANEAEDELEKLLMGSLPKTVASLDLFTTDLTDLSIQQKIDPVIGREDEIERLIQILGRRTKNNPVLLGDPGVGKTAIVEGLAKKIVRGQVPDMLINKKILTLDLGLVLAGTMYRGEFEQRLKQIIDEIKKDPDIIIFIDEIHTLTGAGASAGSLDAANILKPALSRGDIRCIGATTLEEYRKHIESDPALERRFQPIIIEEPNKIKTEEILRGIKENYEKYHQVIITDEAITAAVRLSARYIQNRFLPDKAIDLIDEAAAKLKIKKANTGNIKKIKKIEQGLELLHKKKKDLILAENFSEALEIKEEENRVYQELQQLQAELQKQKKKTLGKITDQDIAVVVSKMTGIPLTELITTEKDKILNLEKLLKDKIISQDEAIRELSESIQRSRTGVANQRRPIGSFIFLGPSGVGKTELAKVLAQILFEDRNALVKIDMSEFKESFNVSKLIGSPPGYVGYKESGQLTEAVRRRPYSVILFDEIEKAHPEIFNILLQVMEDGELTDATGKKINFRNTIIIMTSNVGLKDFVQQRKIGFDAIAQNDDLYEEMKGYLEKSLEDQFRPEFLNRVDKIIVFKPLDHNSLQKIVKLQLAELNNRLSEQNLKVQADQKVVSLLASRNFSPAQGARAVRKNLQELVEGPISTALLKNKFKKNAIIKLRTQANKIILN